MCPLFSLQNLYNLEIVLQIFQMIYLPMTTQQFNIFSFWFQWMEIIHKLLFYYESFIDDTHETQSKLMVASLHREARIFFFFFLIFNGLDKLFSIFSAWYIFTWRGKLVVVTSQNSHWLLGSSLIPRCILLICSLRL